ncbi:MAG: VWA domain-containing protein [Chloroflexota bacterium]
MQLLWPWFLLLLLIIPIAVGFYIWILRRKKRFVVHYSSLSLIKAAMPARSRWRRHLPFALLLIGIASLLVAMTRPQAEVSVPLSRTTIILALDVSRSMCSIDVEPNRLAIAQEAALEFIDNQDSGTQIGIVAFGGLAELAVPPTRDKEILRNAIINLTTSFGTAIGSATLKSIDAIAEINPNVAPSNILLDDQSIDLGRLGGAYEPDIVVLLTDGANSQGPNPIVAAEQAVDRRVRVYTIGFGTDEIADLICSQQQLGEDGTNDIFSFGTFGSGFGNINDLRPFLVIDEDTLQAVAEMTGGEYFRAESADQLFNVFNNLPSQIVIQNENIEISVFFAAFGALLVITAISLSFLWNRFP